MQLNGSLILVEDDAEFAEILQRRFERCGLAVKVCLDHKGAMDALLQRPYDVAILDRCLGGVDGIELAREFKQMDGALQVLMLSGYSDEETIAAAYAAGVDEYLTKPCPLARLEAVVAESIERASTSRQYLGLSTREPSFE